MNIILFVLTASIVVNVVLSGKSAIEVQAEEVKRLLDGVKPSMDPPIIFKRPSKDALNASEQHGIEKEVAAVCQKSAKNRVRTVVKPSMEYRAPVPRMNPPIIFKRPSKDALKASKQHGIEKEGKSAIEVQAEEVKRLLDGVKPSMDPPMDTKIPLNHALKASEQHGIEKEVAAVCQKSAKNRVRTVVKPSMEYRAPVPRMNPPIIFKRPSKDALKASEQHGIEKEALPKPKQELTTILEKLRKVITRLGELKNGEKSELSHYADIAHKDAGDLIKALEDALKVEDKDMDIEGLKEKVNALNFMTNFVGLYGTAKYAKDPEKAKQLEKSALATVEETKKILQDLKAFFLSIADLSV
ncbi:hypothetical protein DdX_20503 [Ditylenchus destructor]|uniref:Uncharacterized protein n=1 Tax=Ditylenchus destructor TaxID=166010 RepID=A0AAD4MG58_9BILA|nr:hypothetical protein DdX_20503 [Ditylenchus destructor]